MINGKQKKKKKIQRPWCRSPWCMFSQLSGDIQSSSTGFELQSRFGDTPPGLKIVCPRNGTAARKGSRSREAPQKKMWSYLLLLQLHPYLPCTTRLLCPYIDIVYLLLLYIARRLAPSPLSEKQNVLGLCLVARGCGILACLSRYTPSTMLQANPGNPEAATRRTTVGGIFAVFNR